MNQQKIAVILQIQGNENIDETVRFLSMQQLAEDVNLELYTVDKSEPKDLEELLLRLNAKYKVFVSNGILLMNPYVLQNFMTIFASGKSIGMIGVSGNSVIPYDGIFWKHRNLGKIDTLKTFDPSNTFGQIELGCLNVEYAGFLGHECYAVCGEIPIESDWTLCEELLPVSMGIEMQKFGKKLVVPRQEHAWCVKMRQDINVKRYACDREKLHQRYTTNFGMNV